MDGMTRLREFAATLEPKLRDIAGQIEGEANPGGEASAHDLLPDEEREAIAWVREHGGIDEIREIWNRSSNLWRRLDKEKAKVERQQRHIEFMQRKCRERQEHICELNKLNRAYVDTLNGVCKRLGLTDGTGLPDMPEVIWAELDRRLMPEGCEWLVEAWPRFEDCKPVKFGDMALIDGEADMVEAVQLWIHGKPVIYGDGGSQQLERSERVKRPTPKVLDADGAEIREGDVLYSIETGDYVIVDSIEPGNPWFVITDGALQHCAKFTHRAPVLAADGKPLHVRETVYEVGGDGTAYVFDGMSEYVDGLAMLHHEDEPYFDTGLHVDQLTHERPVADSWEQLKEDVEKTTCDYFGQSHGCGQCPHYPSECSNDKSRDLVRRARELAERDE